MMEIRLTVPAGPFFVSARGVIDSGGKITDVRIEIEFKEKDMALNPAVSAFAAKVEANFASIKTGIQALDDKITAFNNSPGTLSAEDQAMLDGIVTDSAALATAANAIVPPVPSV